MLFRSSLLHTACSTQPCSTAQHSPAPQLNTALLHSLTQSCCTARHRPGQHARVWSRAEVNHISCGQCVTWWWAVRTVVVGRERCGGGQPARRLRALAPRLCLPTMLHRALLQSSTPPCSTQSCSTAPLHSLTQSCCTARHRPGQGQKLPMPVYGQGQKSTTLVVGSAYCGGSAVVVGSLLDDSAPHSSQLTALWESSSTTLWERSNSTAL